MLEMMSALALPTSLSGTVVCCSEQGGSHRGIQRGREPGLWEVGTEAPSWLPLTGSAHLLLQRNQGQDVWFFFLFILEGMPSLLKPGPRLTVTATEMGAPLPAGAEVPPPPHNREALCLKQGLPMDRQVGWLKPLPSFPQVALFLPMVSPHTPSPG